MRGLTLTIIHMCREILSERFTVQTKLLMPCWCIYFILFRDSCNKVIYFYVNILRYLGMDLDEQNIKYFSILTQFSKKWLIRFKQLKKVMKHLWFTDLPLFLYLQWTLCLKLLRDKEFVRDRNASIS